MNVSRAARAAAVLLAAFLAACAQAPPADTPPVEQMARYQGADRRERLLAAAKAEGSELSVYHVYPALSRVIAAFGQQYGITVKPWRAGSQAVLQRLTNEARGNRFEADVMQNKIGRAHV